MHAGRNTPFVEPFHHKTATARHGSDSPAVGTWSFMCWNMFSRHNSDISSSTSRDHAELVSSPNTPKCIPGRSLWISVVSSWSQRVDTNATTELAVHNACVHVWAEGPPSISRWSSCSIICTLRTSSLCLVKSKCSSDASEELIPRAGCAFQQRCVDGVGTDK